MRYLEKEISKGRDLEKNIPGFAVNMMNVYSKYSYVKLSMNYFTYYEMTGEAKAGDETLLALTEELNKIIGCMGGAMTGEQAEECIARTERIRGEVIQIMTSLTTCVDIFNIYEYCLNRVEYRYKDGSEFLGGSDEELTGELLKYILSDRDNVVINGKISEVVRQLPLRMTRGRFFELLKEGMKVYKDSEKGSVDDLLYMLRTVSILDITDDTFRVSEDIGEICREFAGTDFQELDEEKYNELSGKLGYATDFIQNAVDRYMMLAENINDLYVILLSNQEFLKAKMPALKESFERYREELLRDEKDCENCRILIEKENRLFAGASYEELCEEIEDGFLSLEGKQEKYGELIQKYGYLTDTIKEDQRVVLEQMNLVPLTEYFEKITKLVSGSIFAEFEEKPEKREIAGTAYIEEKYQELEGELKEFFKKNQKNVNRAVMAHILSELPVFFGNVEEIKNYISSSLSSCRDMAEKAAVVQILHDMIQEDL